MQEKNIVANTYWADNERFADVINVGMFQAKKVLSAEQLSERDGYLGHADKKKDLTGIELLSGISREEKLQAMCTLVIYYGKEPWAGPTRLSEMLDFRDLPEEVRNVVADYPIHVLDVRRFEDSEKLESEARLFFGMLQRDEDAGKCLEYWEENKEAFQNLSDDTYEAIVTFTKSENLLENKEVYMNDEGGIDMCKAFEGMILMGEKRGEARSEQQMMRLIQCMAEDGAAESIPRIASEPSFYQEMLKKYNIGNELAVS